MEVPGPERRERTAFKVRRRKKKNRKTNEGKTNIQRNADRQKEFGFY